MDINDRIDYLKNINDRIYEQLAYAETKNGIMIGLLTAILGVIAGVFIAGIQLCCWLEIYFWLILATFTIALIVCIFSFFPMFIIFWNRTFIFIFLIRKIITELRIMLVNP